MKSLVRNRNFAAALNNLNKQLRVCLVNIEWARDRFNRKKKRLFNTVKWNVYNYKLRR